jgi:molecular chaperone GrpE
MVEPEESSLTAPAPEALASPDLPESGLETTPSGAALAPGTGDASPEIEMPCVPLPRPGHQAAAHPAAPAPPAGTEALTDAISGLSDQLSRRLDGLQTILERELRAEVARERVIDRLHAELQEYKQDLLLKVQRPLFMDLIQLHDDVGKLIEARAAGGAEPDRASVDRGILESIQTAIEDILYRQGVEPFTAEGDGFDPRRQRAVATVATAESCRNKTIAGRLRRGFQAGEKLIRPEIVSVFTLRQPPAAIPADDRPAAGGESEPVAPRC